MQYEELIKSIIDMVEINFKYYLVGLDTIRGRRKEGRRVGQ